MAKKPVVEVGETVPRSLKFAIIVAVAIFWAAFFRTILIDIFSAYYIESPIAVDFTLAVIATIVGYIILLTYRKILSKLRKVRV